MPIILELNRSSPALLFAWIAVAFSASANAQPLIALDASTTIPYYIEAGEQDSGYRESDRELAQWAIDAWERAAAGALRFVPAADEAAALLRVHFVPASYGQYGEMRAMLVDGRRGAAVYVRPDTDALGPDIATRAREDALWRDTIVYLTCVHEIGHALGLQHTAEFDDIMYSFQFGGDVTAFFARYRDRLEARGDLAALAALAAGDLAQLQALYAPDQ